MCNTLEHKCFVFLTALENVRWRLLLVRRALEPMPFCEFRTQLIEAMQPPTAQPKNIPSDFISRVDNTQLCKTCLPEET